MRLFHEEIFGPVTPVYTFTTDDGEWVGGCCCWGGGGGGAPQAARDRVQSVFLLGTLCVTTGPSLLPPACRLVWWCCCWVCVCVCAEAVQLANDTEYGLAAYFYTQVGWCRVGVGVGWGAVVEGQGAVGNRQFIRGWPSFVRMDIPSPLPPHPSLRTCRARGGSRSACNTAWWA